MTTALALALSIRLAALGAQDPKVEEILKLMEKRTEGIRDLSFKIDQKADRRMGFPVESAVAVSYVKGAGLRLRATLDAMPDMPFNFVPQSFDVIYAPDALYVIEEFAGGGQAAPPVPGLNLPPMPLTLQAFRLKFGTAGTKNHDFQLVPQGFPIRMMFDEPFPYYMIAPRYFFAREPNLTHAGLKPFGDKPCHVLVSKPAPAEPDAVRPSLWLDSLQKEFFIDSATGALLQIRWEMTARAPRGMGGKSEEKLLFVTEGTGSQKVTESLTLPDSVKFIVHQGKQGRGQNTQEMVRMIRDLKVNAGVTADAILSPAEKNDLYADAVLRPVAEYEARIAKDPKDAEAQYSLAHAKSMLDPFTMMGRMQGNEKPDLGPVARALEKAVEVHPDAEGAILNLLSAYKAAGEEKAEKELLDRIVKGEVKGERIRFRAAGRLNAAGAHERAAKLLESLKPASEPERRRIAQERMFSLAAGGDEAGVAKLFAGEAAVRKDTAEKAALVDALESRIQALPEAAKKKFSPARVLELIDQGSKDAPGDLAYPLARAAVQRLDGNPVLAAIGLLEAAPADEFVVSKAMQALFPTPSNNFGMRGNREPELPKEWQPEESLRLVAALAKAKSADPRAKLAAGRALAMGGKADESRKALAEALEDCRTQTTDKPHHAAALRVAFLLGAEKGPDDWQEKCVDVILTIGKESGSLPYELLYDQSKNPMMGLAAEFVSKKEWLKYYTLACRANKVFKNWYWLRSNVPVPKEAFDAIRAAVLKESEGAKFIELADFLENAHGEGRTDLPDVLEKAVEKLPLDLDLQERLARTYSQNGARDKAISTYEALLPKVAADKKTGLLLELVTLQATSQPEKARKLLAGVDLAALTLQHAQQMIDLCLQSKDWDRGIEACKKGFELGLSPDFPMGLCLEKKENYVEAIRHYNRDRAQQNKDDSEAMARKMEREMRRKFQKSGAEPPKSEDADPENGEEARTRLLKRLGPDYLITRFLTQSFAPLTADEDKSVKAAVEKLSSDESRERDSGYDAIKKIGPRATPALQPLLQSTEPELKARVRQLFTEWAEPK